MSTEERRKDDKRIIQLCVDMAVVREKIVAVDKRINGSIDDFERHIAHGTKWRIAIAVIAIGLIGTSLTVAVNYGEMKSKVKDNCEEISELRMNP